MAGVSGPLPPFLLAPPPEPPSRMGTGRWQAALEYAIVAAFGVLGGVQFARGNAPAGLAYLSLGLSWASFFALRQIWMRAAWYRGASDALGWVTENRLTVERLADGHAE